MRRVHVLLDDRLDVARREGVEIERAFDRDPVGHVTRPYRLAVTTVLMPPRTEKSPTTVIRRGRHDGDEIVEDLVGHRLVEDAAVAELDQVVLQRLQLDAAVAGHVRDPDLAEVREAGLGTDAT